MGFEDNQYYRRPEVIKEFLWFLMIFIGTMLIGSLLQALILHASGIDPLNWQVNAGISRPVLKWSLLIMTIFTFILPAIAFSWVRYKKDIWSFLGLQLPPRISWFMISLIMLFLLLPLIQYSFEINKAIPLPEWIHDMEASANDTLMTLLQMNDVGDLMINLVLIAILPALGEELIFRGIIQQYGYRLLRKPVLSVWITALLFSAIHLQFEGFIPRFLLGMFLGYLYYWTRNLWVPIFIHFANNAFMLVVSYFLPDSMVAAEEVVAPDLPVLGVLATTLLLLPGIYFFKREK